jgi:hypothetical protein
MIRTALLLALLVAGCTSKGPAPGAQPAGRMYASPMFISWTGRPEVEGVTVVSSELAGRGEMALVLTPGVTCTGAYDLSTPDAGTWSLKCTDRSAAGGTISRKAGISTGTGTDSTGRHVAFFIQPGRPIN